MMHFANEDLLDDLDDETEDLILEISEDLVDLDDENEWILILEICLDEYSGDDLDDEVKFVNEKISKRLLKSVLRIRIYDVKRKLLIQDSKRFHEQWKKFVQTVMEDER
jgi:hypothetical protein